MHSDTKILKRARAPDDLRTEQPAIHTLETQQALAQLPQLDP